MTREFKIMDMLSRLMDLLVLNFFFLLTSLPIITIGASLTALFSVNLKLVHDEESYISRNYFHAFRENFLQATAAFLVFLAAGMILCANLAISSRMTGLFPIFLRALASVFLIILAVCFLYYFPILARFRFTQKQILMHILHMIATQYLRFFFLLLLNIPVVFLCMYSVYTAFFVLILGCVLGFSAFTYAECFLFRQIFQPYEIR